MVRAARAVRVTEMWNVLASQPLRRGRCRCNRCLCASAAMAAGRGAARSGRDSGGDQLPHLARYSSNNAEGRRARQSCQHCQEAAGQRTLKAAQLQQHQNKVCIDTAFYIKGSSHSLYTAAVEYASSKTSAAVDLGAVGRVCVCVCVCVRVCGGGLASKRRPASPVPPWTFPSTRGANCSKVHHMGKILAHVACSKNHAKSKIVIKS